MITEKVIKALQFWKYQQLLLSLTSCLLLNSPPEEANARN